MPKLVVPHANERQKVIFKTFNKLEDGELVDLTPDIQPNYEFFKSGLGYSSKDQDNGMSSGLYQKNPAV